MPNDFPVGHSHGLSLIWANSPRRELESMDPFERKLLMCLLLPVVSTLRLQDIAIILTFLQLTESLLDPNIDVNPWMRSFAAAIDSKINWEAVVNENIDNESGKSARVSNCNLLSSAS